MKIAKFGLRPLHLFSGVCLATMTQGSLAQQTTSSSDAQSQSATAASADRANGYIDLQGSVGYSTNSSQGMDGDGSIFGRGSILGFYSINGDRSSTSLSAYAENSFFPNRSGSKNAQLARADIRHSYRASENVTLFGGVDASVDFGSLLSTRYLPAPDPTTNIPPDVIIDPTLFNTRQRSYRVGANVGATLRMSERDNLSLTTSGQKVWYQDDVTGLDFNTFSGDANWNRVLSERSSFGARIGAQHTDYKAPGQSATAYTFQGTLSRALAEDWQLTLGAGISYSIRKTPGDRDKSIGPALDARLCKSSEFESFCGAVSHNVQTAVGANALRTTSASLFWNRRLNRTDSIDARAAVSHFTGDDGYRVNYISGGAAYNHHFSDRLSGGVDVSARDIHYRDGPNVPVDVTGLVFLRYRIGDIRR